MCKLASCCFQSSMQRNSHAKNITGDLQAIKKAKDFEIRKVSRRLKQAQESQTKDAGISGCQATAAQKLQQQLEAAKALDLAALTKMVVDLLPCMHNAATS